MSVESTHHKDTVRLIHTQTIIEVLGQIPNVSAHQIVRDMAGKDNVVHASRAPLNPVQPPPVAVSMAACMLWRICIT